MEIQQRFSASLPKLFAKMEQRQAVHVAFVGDPLLLRDHESPRSTVRAFLEELEELFYYTGGIYEVYDPSHLQERRPKITYECRTTDAQDPGVFQLMQYVSTVGLLNEPDLLVLCCRARRSRDRSGDSGAFLRPASCPDQKRGGGVGRNRSPRFRIRGAITGSQAGYPCADPSPCSGGAAENGIAFYDPNPELFPRAVLFHPGRYCPDNLGKTFSGIRLSGSRGRTVRRPSPGGDSQTVGKALFDLLTEPPKPPRFLANASSGEEKITVNLQPGGNQESRRLDRTEYRRASRRDSFSASARQASGFVPDGSSPWAPTALSGG